jgi:hypothetical protein
VLSKSDGDGDDNDNADNENYTDFEPEIAREIKKTVCHCIAIQKVEVPRNKTAMIEVRFMHFGGGGERDWDMARVSHYSQLQIILDEIQG